MDHDHALKKQAGIKELAEFSNYYEIKLACKLFNVSESELFKMDDGYITKMLLGEKIYNNFESRFIKLKNGSS